MSDTIDNLGFDSLQRVETSLASPSACAFAPLRFLPLRLCVFAFPLLTTGFIHTALALPEPGRVFYGVVSNVVAGSSVRMTSGQLTWTMAGPGGGGTLVLDHELADVAGAYSYLLEVPFETVIAGLGDLPGLLNLVDAPQVYERGAILVNGRAAQIVAASSGALNTFNMGAAWRGAVERVDIVVSTLPGDLDADGLPDAWELANGFDPAQSNDPETDTDEDGYPDLMEYALGGDARQASTAFEEVHTETVAIAGAFHFVIQYKRRKHRPGLEYVAEASADAIQWSSGPAQFEALSVTDLDAEFEWVVQRDRTPLAPDSPRYVRLKIQWSPI